MAVLHRRNRLVSFRVSEEEYEWLRTTSVAQGARSISDFARKAIKTARLGDAAPSGTAAPQQRDLGVAVGKLTNSMEQLSRLIDNLIDRIDQDVETP